MKELDYVRLMASYNEWMNAKLYEAALTLPEAELRVDRKAFFGSILGTLNHIVVADTIWLKRFAHHPANFAELSPMHGLPAPTALEQILFADITALHAHRKMLDQIIIKWVATIEGPELDHVLHYANMKGVVSDKRFFHLMMHFFNHQTHHRGQASTLLFQAGVDVGVTDLMMLIPNQPPE